MSTTENSRLKIEAKNACVMAKTPAPLRSEI